ncbi:MAG: dynamin family protein, partial [Halofilum sp. (in: g-proteobacteria)]
RRWLARRVARDLPQESASGNWRAAFLKSTRPGRALFARPKGLGKRQLSRLHKLRDEAESYIQKLNNQFVDASAVAPGAGRASAADVHKLPEEGPGTPVDAELQREGSSAEAGRS